MKDLIAQMKEAMKLTYCLKTQWDIKSLTFTQELILENYCNLLFEYDGNEQKALDTLTTRIESLIAKFK